MNIVRTSLPEVLAITPERFGDARGYFSESWNAAKLAAAGLDLTFVQDNESLSAKPATVRGLHFQAPPHAQDKLVRVARGRVMDVAVDIRRGSPRYGQWVARELSAENGVQLLVPKGFLHGFATLEPHSLVLYKCSDHYAPDCDGSVRFDSLGIEWGIDPANATLSAKDAAAPEFSAFESPFSYEGAP